MGKENDFVFNDFLYLDEDFLRSFIAQKYNGFVKEKQDARINESIGEEIGEQKNTIATLDGEVGVGFASINGNSQHINNGAQSNHTNSEQSQKAFVKVEKENMYHDFTGYVKEKGLWTDADSMDTGSYIDLNEEFYFIDFERIRKLYSSEDSPIYESYMEHMGFSKEKIESMVEKVDRLHKLQPFDAILYNKKYMVTIDKTWLKIKKEYVGYKLGKRVNVMGKICKPIQADENLPDLINLLNSSQACTLLVLQELGFSVADSVFVISPIAIYC